MNSKYNNTLDDRIWRHLFAWFGCIKGFTSYLHIFTWQWGLHYETLQYPKIPNFVPEYEKVVHLGELEFQLVTAYGIILEQSSIILSHIISNHCFPMNSHDFIKSQHVEPLHEHADGPISRMNMRQLVSFTFTCFCYANFCRASIYSFNSWISDLEFYKPFIYNAHIQQQNRMISSGANVSKFCTMEFFSTCIWITDIVILIEIVHNHFVVVWTRRIMAKSYKVFNGIPP